MKHLAFLLLCACPILRAQETLTLEKIEADRSLWPVEVMVTVDHKLPVVIDGKVVRTLKVGPGNMYKVKDISAAGVSLHSLGSPLVFKAEDTDVIARAGQIRTQQEALAAATPTPAPVLSPSSQPERNSAINSLKVPESDRQSLSQAIPPAAPRGLAAKLAGQLVRLNGGRLEPFDAAKLSGKKYLAVYFSASWCGPCRRFTPALVDWYRLRQPYIDMFDVIFVSADQSEQDMTSYMAGDHMEWPAVSYSRARISPLTKYGGRGIPCLVILNENGSVLSHSYDGDNYLGPMKPLKDLDRLLTGS